MKEGGKKKKKNNIQVLMLGLYFLDPLYFHESLGIPSLEHLYLDMNWFIFEAGTGFFM